MDQSIRKRPVPLKEDKPAPEPFQHFTTEQEWEEHLRQVKEAQDNGLVPF